MKILSRTVFSSGNDLIPSLRQQRQRLLNALLLSSLILGTILFVLALFPVFHKHLPSGVLVFYICVYLWLALIAFVRRLPYWLRLDSFLVIIYLLGAFNLLTSGLNVDAGMFLLAFVGMATFFSGLLSGILAIVMSGITLTVFGWLAVGGMLELGIALPQSDPLLWAIGGLIFVLMSILLAITATSLLRGLGASEEYYRSLIENSTDLTMILERTGAIRTVTPAVERVFGYSQAELVGRSIFELIHPEDQKLPKDALSPEVPAEEIGETIELRARHKDGSWRWLEVRGQALYDHPAVRGAVVNARDITERKRAEQLLQQAYSELESRVVERTAELQRAEVQYERLYQTMRDGFVRVDMSGRIRQCNQVYLEMLGYTQQEILRKSYQDLTPLKWQAVEERIIATQILPRGFSDLYEKEYRRKDGSVFPVELRTILLRDEAGQPSGMWAFIHDITERKRIEQSLQDGEQRYRDLLDHAPQAMAVMQDNRIVYANQAMAQLMRVKLEELTTLQSENFLPRVHADDRAHLATRLQGERPEDPGYETFPMRILDQTGQMRWLEVTALSIQYEDRPAIQFTAVDLTERKQTLDALHEREQLNTAILDSSQLYALVVERDGTIVTANERLARQFGRTVSELIGTCCYDLLPADIAASRRAKVEAVFPSRQPMLFEDSRNGRWFENSIYPIADTRGEVNRAVILSRDITERREAELAVLESEARYRTLAEAAPDMIYIIDREDRVQYVNSFAASYLGVPMEEILGQPRSRFFPEPIEKRQYGSLQQVTRSATSNYVESENQFRGRSVWLGTWLVPLRDVNGEPTGVMGISRDITTRVLTEQKLRESEERYRTLAEAAPEMIYIVDREGRIEYINTFAARMVGQGVDQLIGQHWSFAASSPVDNPGRNTLLDVLATGESSYVEGEYRVRDHSLWLGSWLVPLRDAEGKVSKVLGISRDVTERKRFEMALVEARDQLEQRVQERTVELEASQARMQQLAEEVITAQEQERRGISRELHDEAGQMLITLKYSLMASLQELPEGSEASRASLQQALDTLDSTIHQVRNLAHALRPPALEVAGLDLSLKELCQEIAARTRLHIEYVGQALPPLPDEIGISLYRFVQEALTNVLKHAKATRVRVTLEQLHSQLLVTVADNGQGMAEDVKEGMGLLGMRERLKLLNGEMVISSPSNRGTKLLVRVPWKGEETGKPRRRKARSRT